MKRFLLTAAALASLALPLAAQRVMDKLDRGLVAVKTDGGVFVSWRVFGEDPDAVKFNLYRDGTLVNQSPLSVSNFSDPNGNEASTYIVKTVVDGEELTTSKQAKTESKGYLEIKIAPVPSNKDGKDISSHYEPNDATVADLDGDGELEILLKLRNNTFHSQGYPQESTDYDIIQVYKLDGTLMWWIDCGRNMVDFQSNEINIAAYDWDLDGKAECIMRAADGTVIHMADGTAKVIGDPTVDTLADARENGMTEKFTHTGAEYLLYLNGETGSPYQVMDYPLKRLEEGEKNLADAWGDGYGHRSSKYFFGAPYLNGRTPSIFLARGIYTRHKMIAYDVDPSTHELIVRWEWVNNSPGSPWYGQGYHNYCIGDVDWDGRDEIVFGSMVIDDNGRGLSTTGLGHGDSQHLGDFNPYIYGQEIVACNEDNPNNNYRDATTSKIYYRATSTADDGRAIAGNFTNDYPGAQFITAHDSESLISTVTNEHLKGATPTSDIAQNFRIFWDGDLLDETFNYQNGKNTPGTIYKFRKGAIQVFTGTMTNNDTKGTPCFQGDILGDWREELILRSADNSSIRIYTTTFPTEHRIYTLLHDPQYRNAMVWQMNGYNQAPHQSFFLGELEGITQAPPSPTMNNRIELKEKETLGTNLNGQNVVFATVGNATASIANGASPELFIDNAPSWVQGHQDNDAIEYEYFTHTLTGDGFTGNTRVVKLGAGTLVLPNVKQSYTGNTDVWFGTLSFDGEMEESKVWMNRSTCLMTNGGRFNKGIELNYGSELKIGNSEEAGLVYVSDLYLNFGSKVYIDLFAEGNTSDKINASNLYIQKKDWKNGPKYSTPIIVFTPHYNNTESLLPEGEYEIATFENIDGNIDDIVIEGLNGQKANLSIADNKLILKVFSTRGATDVIWTGSESGVWDLAETENFKLAATGEPTSFVTGDRVTFDDNAISTEINIPEGIYPSEIVFNNSSKDFVVKGAPLEGEIDIEKKGTGRVTLENTNSFKGQVTINNGILEVLTLGANEGEEYGGLGHYSNEIVMNNGGILSVAKGSKTSHPFNILDGGIEVKNASLTLTGTFVTGNGNFIKAGPGQLNMTAANNIAVMTINEGAVYDEGDTHQLASTVIFNGKNVELKNMDSRTSYSTDNTNFIVPENMSGKLTMDGRCSYRGTLTGAGQLTVVASFVRNYLEGDWSEFTGTLVASQPSGTSFDFYNKYGLPNATLSVNGGFQNTDNNGGACRNDKMQIGALAGSGTITGRGTYYVGEKNDDFTFAGAFSGVNFVKEGTGTMTISKVQPNLGTVTVNKGGLHIKVTAENKDKTLTGTGNLIVRGVFTGSGCVGNEKAFFQEGSYIKAYNTIQRLAFRTFYFLGDVKMDEGSTLECPILSNTSYGSIDVKGKLTQNGKVIVALEGYTPTIGDEFILWTAADAEGIPSLQLPELPEGFYWSTEAITPTEGKLVVTDVNAVSEIDAAKIAQCAVFDLSGICLKKFTSTVGDALQSVKQLGKGIYVLRYTADGITRSLKLEN